MASSRVLSSFIPSGMQWMKDLSGASGFMKRREEVLGSEFV